ncbi:MAG: hypothetical protein JXR96_14505 [Deltaproteobacteria bacterium]|nr:hypothetical protein [Deltaproteobacteria bacterium]
MTTRGSTRALTAFFVLAFALAPGCDRPDDFPQFARDAIVAYGTFVGVVSLYLDHVAMLPDGQQDIEADCPSGGKVSILGTTSSQGGMSLELDYVFDQCAFELGSVSGGSGVALELEGSLHYSVSYDASGLGTESVHSEELSVKGDVAEYPDQCGIDLKCAYNLTYVATEISTSFYGDLCDRPVSAALTHEAGEP